MFPSVSISCELVHESLSVTTSIQETETELMTRDSLVINTVFVSSCVCFSVCFSTSVALSLTVFMFVLISPSMSVSLFQVKIGHFVLVEGQLRVGL